MLQYTDKQTLQHVASVCEVSGVYRSETGLNIINFRHD